MAAFLTEIWSSIPNWMRKVMGIRFDKSPIQTVDKLQEFVQTRAAYIAQTSLYGYLKTRMGIRFREVFEDDEFQPSINNAKWRTYGACLSDLAVFAAATASVENRLDSAQSERLARHIFTRAVQEKRSMIRTPKKSLQMSRGVSIPGLPACTGRTRRWERPHSPKAPAC